MGDVTQLVLGQSGDVSVALPLKYANRHGLISGATGSGKTVSLQVLAEQFSRAGTSVLLPDIKGDLQGLACAGVLSEGVQKELSKRGQAVPVWSPAPVRTWCIDATPQQSRLQATITSLGPLLLAQLLDLSDVQAAVLQVVFRIAREHRKPLNSLTDLRQLLLWVQASRAELATAYGAIAESTISAIQRALLVLEEQRALGFFAAQQTPLEHLIQTHEGRGVVNLLDATSLLHQPVLYATVFSWLLSRLYEELPEAGDLAQPRLVIFIDEAHLLFETLGKTLQDNLQRTVRLIRSRGVGVYFVTQLPSDVPDEVLGQLGNRIQHVLRAYTPRDQKGVHVAAQTMRPSPGLDIEAAITQLAPGEALVSVLDDHGTPTPTQRIWMCVPQSHMGLGPDPQYLPVLQGGVSEPSRPSGTPAQATPTALRDEAGRVLPESVAMPIATGAGWRPTLLRGLLATCRWLLRA